MKELAEETPMIGEGTITYTGEELRQDDETVWLQLIHLAKLPQIPQRLFRMRNKS